MTTVVDVVNMALLEGGQRVTIASLTENSVAAQTASVLYTPKIQMLLRAAPWDFARRQVTLSQLKATYINNVLSTNPPPSPWSYEYAYPSDCIKARFVIPTQPTSSSLMISPAGGTVQTPNYGTYTAMPFVVATDYDTNNQPNKVILTNLNQAQLIYVADLSQLPNLWDPLFLSCASAYLAAWLLNADARNKGQFEMQMQMAKSILDQARVQNANEAITSIDHTPDWIRIRNVSSGAWGPGTPSVSWDAIDCGNGLSY